MADSHQPLGRGAARGVQPAGGDARRGGLPRLPVDRGWPSSTSAPAPSAASDRDQRSRLGDDRRRRLPGGRRLLRADHPAQPAARRHVLGARHDARPRAALPRDRLEPQLHALRASRAGSSREVAADWEEQRALGAASCCSARRSLLEIVQLLGADSLAAPSASCCAPGRLLREDFLQQSAFDELDAYCDAGQAARDAAGDPAGARGDEPRRSGRRLGRRACRRRRARPTLARMRELAAGEVDASAPTP